MADNTGLVEISTFVPVEKFDRIADDVIELLAQYGCTDTVVRVPQKVDA